jgi:hypothetical protein
LTGFARCGRCGEPLTGAPNAHHRRYACVTRVDRPNCGRIARQAEPVDDLVTQMLFEALRGVDLRDFLESQDDGHNQRLAEEVRGDEAALNELSADFYVGRTITRSQFVTAQASLNARLEANRARLSTTSAGSMLATIDAGEGLERRWADETLDWKRAVIGTIIESIIVNPVSTHGRRVFDPTAIVVKWKF